MNLQVIQFPVLVMLVVLVPLIDVASGASDDDGDDDDLRMVMVELVKVGVEVSHYSLVILNAYLYH